MPIGEEELVGLIGSLSVQRLHKWIRLGWVRPERHEGAARFHDADIARVRLLYDLEYDMELDDDTVMLILSLLDQNYTLRSHVQALASAIVEQPPGVRERLLNAYRRHAET